MAVSYDQKADAALANTRQRGRHNEGNCAGATSNRFIMKQSMIFLGLLLLIAGCSFEQGHRFDANSVRRLQPGVTTEQDAIALLGPPAATNNNGDGTQLLQWQYVYGTTTSWVGSAHAAILFGPDRKMVRLVEVFQQ